MNIKKKILNLVFPKICVNCHKIGFWLCQTCKKTIIKIKYSFCPKCKKITNLGRFCPRCKRQSVIRGVIAYGYYKGALKELVHFYKYRNVLEIKKFLANYIIDKTQDGLPRGDLILVPIPLHPRKQNERGFNQCYEIGRELEKNLDIKLVDCLKRVKYTKSQIGLSHFDRLKNLQGAFAFKSNIDITGKTVLLLDDVYTSGATMATAAKVLRQNGAKDVWGICVAMA